MERAVECYEEVVVVGFHGRRLLSSGEAMVPGYSIPGLSFALGASLVLLVVIIVTVVASCCYHLRLEATTAASRFSPPPSNNAGHHNSSAAAAAAIVVVQQAPPPSFPTAADHPRFAEKHNSGKVAVLGLVLQSESFLAVVMPGNHIASFMAWPSPLLQQKLDQESPPLH